MADALTQWQRQQVTGASRLAPEVERDVADIWRLLIEDTGAWRRGSFVCCGTRARCRVVNPEVTVQLHGGVPRRETVYPPLAVSDLLFMPTGQMAMLTMIHFAPRCVPTMLLTKCSAVAFRTHACVTLSNTTKLSVGLSAVTVSELEFGATRAGLRVARARVAPARRAAVHVRTARPARARAALRQAARAGRIG